MTQFHKNRRSKIKSGKINGLRARGRRDHGKTVKVGPQAQQAKASLNLSTKEGKRSDPLPVPPRRQLRRGRRTRLRQLHHLCADSGSHSHGAEGMVQETEI